MLALRGDETMIKHQKSELILKERKRQQKQRRLHKKIAVLCMTAFLLGVLCGKMVFAKEEPEKISVKEQTEIQKEEPEKEKVENIHQGRIGKEETTEGEMWRLVLVNAAHAMEEGYVPELAEIENDYYFDERAVESLQKMLTDGRKEGMDFLICSAYRSAEKQKSLYDNKVQRLMAEGMSYGEAYEEAAKEIAYPGTSEHQLGLAVDIVAKDYQLLDDKQEDTKEAKWLRDHCWKYGFILRYPTDKTEETGIIFEPWHYRYVGEMAAKEIMEKGMCLEEYLILSES